MILSYLLMAIYAVAATCDILAWCFSLPLLPVSNDSHLRRAFYEAIVASWAWEVRKKGIF